MALEGHRTLLCAEVVDWLVLVACFRDIRDSIFLNNNQNVGSNANSGSGALVAGRVGPGAHACAGPAAGELFKHQWSLFSSRSRQQSLTGLPWERSGMAVNAESRRGEHYAALLLSAQRQKSARH